MQESQQQSQSDDQVMDEIQWASEEIDLALEEEVANNETTCGTARYKRSKHKGRRNIDKANAFVTSDGSYLCGKCGRPVGSHNNPRNLARDFKRRHSLCFEKSEEPYLK